MTVFLVLLVGMAGCIYRIDIQQGNLLDPEAVEQVQEGMNRSQVKYLLGTPMVNDPFSPDRWDYVYYFRQGRSQEVLSQRVTIFFEGDNVARIEKIDPVVR